MSSCEEAMFHLNQCGRKSLDRDKDGVPCEKICKWRQSLMMHKNAKPYKTWLKEATKKHSHIVDYSGAEAYYIQGAKFNTSSL